MIVLDTNVLSALMLADPDIRVVEWLESVAGRIDLDNYGHLV